MAKVDSKGQDTSTNSTVESGRKELAYMCHRLTTQFFSSFQSYSQQFGRVHMIPPYDLTVELDREMWHDLKNKRSKS